MRAVIETMNHHASDNDRDFWPVVTRVFPHIQKNVFNSHKQQETFQPVNYSVKPKSNIPINDSNLCFPMKFLNIYRIYPRHKGKGHKNENSGFTEPHFGLVCCHLAWHEEISIQILPCRQQISFYNLHSINKGSTSQIRFDNQRCIDPLLMT